MTKKITLLTLYFLALQFYSFSQDSSRNLMSIETDSIIAAGHEEIEKMIYPLIDRVYAVSNINTDRPDQTESQLTIPKKSLQIESGFLVQSEDIGGVKLEYFQLPTNLIRYGITKNIELRFIGQFEKTSIKVGDTKFSSSQFHNLEFGTKIQLYRKQGKRFQSALLVHYVSPIVLGKSGNHGSAMISKLAVGGNLTDKISLGANVGYNTYNSGEDELTYSLALGIGLAPKLGSYLESYGALAGSNNWTNNFDFGFTYLARPNLQLDISSGFGLNNSMKYLSLGASWNIQFKQKNR